MRLFASFLSCILALGLSAAELSAPLVRGLGAPGSVLGADLPWHENFTVLGSGEKPVAPTRFKIAHDNKNLYLAVEAFEPEMGKLVAKPYPHDHADLWRNDVIEVNFDPDGRNVALGKVIVDANGSVADYFGLDDNTGYEQFVLDTCWESGAKVISARKLADRWTLELALPIGAWFDGERKTIANCRLNVGRSRNYGGRQPSSFVPIPSNNHGLPRFFPVLKLENFNESRYNIWQIVGLKSTGRIRQGKAAAEVSAQIQNTGAKFRAVLAQIRLTEEASGKSVKKQIGIAATPHKLTPVELALAGVAAGRVRLGLELRETDGTLLAAQYLPGEIDYQPVRIKLLEPAYRDNVYATQKLDKIVAEVTLEEGVGAPLEAVLTGPGGFRKVRKIAAAQSVNTITFPFVDMPEGEYKLSVAGVSKRIRKLPRMPGEVFFDADGAAYVDGKPFFPLGFFAVPVGQTSFEREINCLTSSNDTAKNGDVVKKTLDRFAAHGVKVLHYPYIEPSGKRDIFSCERNSNARKGAKLSPKQRELIAEFVAVSHNHPGFFAYYLADEPEGWQHNPSWYEDLRNYLAEIDPWHPTMIVNYGLEGQRQFVRGCDVHRPDCYPSYFLDGTTALPRIYTYDFCKHASLRHPTWLTAQFFDWGKKNSKGSPGRGPTYDELREQVYLGLNGDARGILSFKYPQSGMMTGDLRIGRRYVYRELDALKEFALRPTVPVTAKPVSRLFNVGQKVVGNRFIVIAVNLSDKPIDAEIQLKGKVPSSLAVSGEKRSVAVQNGCIRDRFEPHTTHIYATEGVKVDAVDHAAVRAEIAAAKAALKRPGNLAAAGELSRGQLQDYRKGIIPPGVPKISVSSQLATHDYKECATQYFLQDGLRRHDDISWWDLRSWTPLADDKVPWVEIDFGKPVKIGRALLCIRTRGNRVLLLDGRLVATDADGKEQEVARFADNKEKDLELKFPPVTANKLKLIVDKRLTWDRLLTEFEVYSE